MLRKESISETKSKSELPDYIKEEIYRKWEVVDCPCTFETCNSSLIPGIADLQGIMPRPVAEHIVEIHNKWLEEGLNEESF